MPRQGRLASTRAAILRGSFLHEKHRDDTGTETEEEDVEMYEDRLEFRKGSGPSSRIFFDEIEALQQAADGLGFEIILNSGQVETLSGPREGDLPLWIDNLSVYLPFKDDMDEESESEEDIPSPIVLCEGQCKVDRKNKVINRYFVLDEEGLRYYTSKQDHENKAFQRGLVRLEDVEHLEELEDRIVMGVRGHEKPLEMVTENVDEKRQWIQALTPVLRKHLSSSQVQVQDEDASGPSAQKNIAESSNTVGVETPPGSPRSPRAARGRLVTEKIEQNEAAERESGGAQQQASTITDPETPQDVAPLPPVATQNVTPDPTPVPSAAPDVAIDSASDTQAKGRSSSKRSTSSSGSKRAGSKESSGSKSYSTLLWDAEKETATPTKQIKFTQKAEGQPRAELENQSYVQMLVRDLVEIFKNYQVKVEVLRKLRKARMDASYNADLEKQKKAEAQKQVDLVVTGLQTVGVPEYLLQGKVDELSPLKANETPSETIDLSVKFKLSKASNVQTPAQEELAPILSKNRVLFDSAKAVVTFAPELCFKGSGSALQFASQRASFSALQDVRDLLSMYLIPIRIVNRYQPKEGRSADLSLGLAQHESQILKVLLDAGGLPACQLECLTLQQDPTAAEAPVSFIFDAASNVALAGVGSDVASETGSEVPSVSGGATARAAPATVAARGASTPTVETPGPANVVASTEEEEDTFGQTLSPATLALAERLEAEGLRGGGGRPPEVDLLEKCLVLRTMNGTVEIPLQDVTSIEVENSGFRIVSRRDGKTYFCEKSDCDSRRAREVFVSRVGTARDALLRRTSSKASNNNASNSNSNSSNNNNSKSNSSPRAAGSVANGTGGDRGPASYPKPQRPPSKAKRTVSRLGSMSPSPSPGPAATPAPPSPAPTPPPPPARTVSILTPEEESATPKASPKPAPAQAPPATATTATTATATTTRPESRAPTPASATPWTPSLPPTQAQETTTATPTATPTATTTATTAATTSAFPEDWTRSSVASTNRPAPIGPNDFPARANAATATPAANNQNSSTAARPNNNSNNSNNNNSNNNSNNNNNNNSSSNKTVGGTRPGAFGSARQAADASRRGQSATGRGGQVNRGNAPGSPRGSPQKSTSSLRSQATVKRKQEEAAAAAREQAEVDAAFAPRFASGSPEGALEAQLREIFTACDRDRRGFISAGSLATAVRNSALTAHFFQRMQVVEGVSAMDAIISEGKRSGTNDIPWGTFLDNYVRRALQKPLAEGLMTFSNGLIRFVQVYPSELVHYEDLDAAMDGSLVAEIQRSEDVDKFENLGAELTVRFKDGLEIGVSPETRQEYNAWYGALSAFSGQPEEEPSPGRGRSAMLTPRSGAAGLDKRGAGRGMFSVGSRWGPSATFQKEMTSSMLNDWIADRVVNPPICHGVLGVPVHGVLAARYAILYQDRLVCYERPLDCVHNTKEVLYLPVDKIRRFEKTARGFILDAPARKMAFRAQSNSEAQAWAEMLVSVLQPQKATNLDLNAAEEGENDAIGLGVLGQERGPPVAIRDSPRQLHLPSGTASIPGKAEVSPRSRQAGGYKAEKPQLRINSHMYGRQAAELISGHQAAFFVHSKQPGGNRVQNDIAEKISNSPRKALDDVGSVSPSPSISPEPPQGKPCVGDREHYLRYTPREPPGRCDWHKVNHNANDGSLSPRTIPSARKRDDKVCGKVGERNAIFRKPPLGF